METRVIRIDSDNIDPDHISQAAELVKAGKLVAFPTETVYGIACRVEPAALAELDHLKGRQPDKYYTLHIAETTETCKYVPTIGLQAEKLINNAWPGPLTIVFELDAHDIEKLRNRFSEHVLEHLYKDNSIGIRCPDNPVAAALLRAVNGPVVAPSANITGQPPATDAHEVLARFSGQIDLLLDAGPCKYKKSSTVVKVCKKGPRILREGVYSQADVEAMSQISFLFVCTGNTCRSPMAEAIFRKYLAEKIGCKVDFLGSIGYKTSSAGTMGMAGLPASPEAVAACEAKGIDIHAHTSTALSAQLIAESDFIFAMGRMHRDMIIAITADAAGKCVLLAEKHDIPDPIGQPQQVYNDCADLIERAVKERVGRLII